ncbi:MAG: DUF4167 domain-containing protein [Caulobacter sp.]|nr:DUF4167 domain-containing protein [Caulobacter sp.]
MRDFKGMKRQRGRNRGSGGNNQGGKPQHNANRAFDSNGPEGIKVRGAAQGVFEKYQQLSRDAASGGDRVLAENYLQHAEHYFRTLRAMQPHRPVSDIVGREQFSSGFDIDFEAEPGEPPEGGYVPETEGGEGEGQRDNNNQGGQRFDNNRPRDGQRFEGRDRQRDDRPRDDRPREDRPARDERPRDDRPRDDKPREERPRQEGEASGGRRDRWRERDERRDRERAEAAARDPLAVVEPQAAAPLAPEPAASESPRLRGQDGAVSELPAFLGRPAAVSEEAPAEEAKKPRRRRAPRSFEGGEDAKPETEKA